MRKTSILLCIVVFCVGLVWAFALYAAPRVEFVEGVVFDFGNVQANETLTHIFVFKNTGDKVLKVEQVKGG
jgi:hypothetical protein